MIKKIFNLSLMAALLCGLSLSVTSCKDDDDSNAGGDNNSQQDADTEVVDATDTPEKHLAWTWISSLADVDNATENWESQTFEPIIGEESQNEAQARLLYVNDLEEARASFSAIAGCNPNDLKGEKTISAGDYGTMEWTPSPANASNLATVQVDCRLMPKLSKLIYCTAAQAPDNAAFTGTAYYRLGDVVEDAEGYYWVCVRPSFSVGNLKDSYWVNIFNAAETGRGVKTGKLPGIPEKNIYSKYNKKYNNNIILLPTGLKLNRQQNYQLSNLVWAMLNPEAYKGIVGTGNLNAICGLPYKYHGENYLTNVARYWDEKDIWQKVFNRTYEEMKSMKSFNLFYYGYHWKVGSTAGVWKYHTNGYQMAYSGSENDDDKLYEMKKAGYGFDIRRYAGDPNADKDCASTNAGQDMAPAKQFNENGDYYWVVRFATGKQLDKKYDPYKNLTGVRELYRYNQVTNQLSSSEAPVPEDESIVTDDIEDSGYKLNFAGSAFYGSYAIGDILKDEQDSRWICVAPCFKGQAFNKDSQEDEAWFVSFDNITFNDNNVATNEDLVTEDEIPLLTCRLASLFTALTQLNNQEMQWLLGIDTEKKCQTGLILDDIKKYTTIDLNQLIYTVDSTMVVNDKDHLDKKLESSSQSPIFSFAYRNGNTQKQPVMRAILDYTQAGKARTSQPLQYQYWRYRMYKNYAVYDPSKIDEPNEDEVKYLNMTKWHKPWVNSNQPMYLQDIESAELVNKYGKSDKWVSRPIRVIKTGSKLTYTSVTPRTATENLPNLKTLYAEASNKGNVMDFYSKLGAIGMYRNPVLFMRVMKVRDTAKKVNMKSVDGKTLSAVMIRDNIELYLGLVNFWLSYEKERSGFYYLDEKSFDMPQMVR